MDTPLLEQNDPMSIADKHAMPSTSSDISSPTDNLVISDDILHMSFDNISLIGENVTVGDRLFSSDSTLKSYTNTPNTETIESPMTTNTQTPLNTPVSSNVLDKEEIQRKKNLLKLSLAKITENDIFVKPSPLEVMSPAKMLQFEVDAAKTPTMKRAIIDFEFFKKEKEAEEKTDELAYKETPVIVKADTVRHEIGYVRAGTGPQLMLGALAVASSA